MKVLAYFVKIIQKHSVDASQSTKFMLNNGGSSTKQLRSNSSFFGLQTMSTELDPDILELLLALKTIHAMLTGQGNLEAPRDLILRYIYYFIS